MDVRVVFFFGQICRHHKDQAKREFLEDGDNPEIRKIRNHKNAQNQNCFPHFFFFLAPLHLIFGARFAVTRRRVVSKSEMQQYSEEIESGRMQESEVPVHMEGDERGQSKSGVLMDYVTVFKMMGPSYAGPSLSKTQHCRLLPLATGIQMFWVFIFFVVELSAGAGGTSGVAGTRTVLILFMYIFLLMMTVLIARTAARGTLNNSSLVSSMLHVECG